MNVKPFFKNPFQVGQPIRKPDYFIGRKNILQSLSNALLERKNISLHGERRTGKTSLLFYLTDHSVSSILGLPEKHIPVYLSFQEFANAKTVNVWKSIANAIAEQIELKLPDGKNESKKFLETVQKYFKFQDEPELFGTGLSKGLYQLYISGFNFHLLFDEFEQTALNPNLGEQFYNTLRGLYQRTENISYVIATRIGLAELQLMNEELPPISSPFFNIFTTVILNPLEKDEVHSLIFDYFEMADLDKSLSEKLWNESSFLFDITGYHPFFLQMLCYHMCSVSHEYGWPLGSVREKALLAFEENCKEHFEFYWKISSKEEQNLIKKLAGKQSVRWDKIENVAITEKLRDRCLIIKTNLKKYRLFSSSFRKYINRYYPSIQVFICHVKEDREIAYRLYKDIKRAGVSTWMTEEDILTGQDRKKTVSQAIKKSDYFIVLLSRHSVSKKASIQKELKLVFETFNQIGDEKKIFIIPIRIDGCIVDDERLSSLHSIDLFPSDINYKKGLDKILQVIAPSIKGLEKSMKKDKSRFISRENEINDVCSDNAPPYILFEAPAGYGKTELLKEILHRHSYNNWFCIYLEINKNISSGNELAIQVASKAGCPELNYQSDDTSAIGLLLAAFLKKEISASGSPGAILLIDNLERLAESEIKSFLNYLLIARQESFKLRICLARRYNGMRWKLTDKFSSVKTLPFFSFDHIKDAVRLFCPDLNQDIDLHAAHLMQITGGHPYCISHILLDCMKFTQVVYKSDNKTQPEDYKEIVLSKANQIRETIPESLRDPVDVLSIFRRYNYRLLKQIINERLLDYKDGADKLEQALIANYFVERKDGFLRDDVVRPVLAIRLLWETPERFIKLCEKAAQIYENEMANPIISRPENISIEGIYQELQLAYYKGKQTRAERYGLYSQFFDDNGILYKYLEKIASHLNAQDTKGNFIEILENKKDWEFQFAVNFFLRGDHYNNDPYEKLLKQVTKFFYQKSGESHA
ncbi:MAG: TIR domain-containing protein [Desulfobacteraceae bacterium]|nr:TIR domain-containing protein [Desulfobacteraceae bacterium]